jgi:chromosome transmission fidelity protein 18
VLAFHSLFASPRQHSSNPVADPDETPLPFSGPGANFAAAEQFRANRSQLMALQSTLSLHLTRMFRSPEEMALELIPYTLRMLAPDIKPVIVNTSASGSKSFASATVRKASEKALVRKSVEAMAATGIRFEKSRIDILGSFETHASKRDDKARYAIRSVLEQEWRLESARLDMENRKRRGGQTEEDEVFESQKEEKTTEEKALEANARAVKRDFFGRVIVEKPLVVGAKKIVENVGGDVGRIWVSYREGYSNAVRKPVTVDELLRGL